MHDTTNCPVCGMKMRTINLKNRWLHSIGKQADYIERTCTKGLNHTLQLFTDRSTKQVDFLKTSLNPQYSKFLEIDYVNQKCRLSCIKGGQTEYIAIEKMITPDFPDLIKLKERISLYVTFS